MSSEATPIDEVFLTSFKAAYDFETLSPVAQSFIKDLAKQQKSDFASPSGGYFSIETQEAISKEAIHRLVKALEPLSAKDLEVSVLKSEWQKIVADFYRSQSWGFTTQKQKPAKVLTKDQKIAREITPYIWAAFQAWIVMKLVIYYFGIEAADNPDESHIFLYLGLAFSFGSLFYFAWRKSRKGE